MLQVLRGLLLASLRGKRNDIEESPHTFSLLSDTRKGRKRERKKDFTGKDLTQTRAWGHSNRFWGATMVQTSTTTQKKGQWCKLDVKSKITGDSQHIAVWLRAPRSDESLNSRQMLTEVFSIVTSRANRQQDRLALPAGRVCVRARACFQPHRRCAAALLAVRQAATSLCCGEGNATQHRVYWQSVC